MAGGCNKEDLGACWLGVVVVAVVIAAATPMLSDAVVDAGSLIDSIICRIFSISALS